MFPRLHKFFISIIPETSFTGGEAFFVCPASRCVIVTRLKGFVKFSRPVAGDEMGLRLSTPEVVASYIARRLKCQAIADLGCGIGGQTVFLARECKRVFAVEQDRSRLEYARHNCKLYNVSNVVFVEGSALSPQVRERLRGVEVVFSDPARPLSEETRKLESLTPPPLEVLEFYQGVTDRFAFQVPPFLSPSRIPFECEMEYISLGGQLNRLTLYLGGLASCERSAVVLPEGARLCNIQEGEPEPVEEVGRFVYEPEPSVAHARLLGELCQLLPDLKIYQAGWKRPLLTSDTLLSSPFFKDSYQVLGHFELDWSRIKKFLRKTGAGRVVPRLEVRPEDYWKLRKDLENGLKGEETVHIFAHGDRVVICRKLR